MVNLPPSKCGKAAIPAQVPGAITANGTFIVMSDQRKLIVGRQENRLRFLFPNRCRNKRHFSHLLERVIMELSLNAANERVIYKTPPALKDAAAIVSHYYCGSGFCNQIPGIYVQLRPSTRSLG